MIELKPSAAILAMAVNLSPVNPPRKTGKFATDFYVKFDGESFKTAAKSGKFKNKARAKTLASVQIKFNPNAGSKREQFWLTNLTDQTFRTANQTRVNLACSERSEMGIKFSLNLTKRH